MPFCDYTVHTIHYTGQPGLHLNKGNPNQSSSKRKRAKGVVCETFVTYLLADWSNLILHIHDDHC